MKLTSNYVLVKKDESGKTAGGIYIPEIGTIPMQLGTVVQVGPGKYNPMFDKRVPIEVNIGDRVIFNPGVAIEINITQKDEKGNSTKVKLLQLPDNECSVVLEDNEEI